MTVNVNALSFQLILLCVCVFFSHLSGVRF